MIWLVIKMFDLKDKAIEKERYNKRAKKQFKEPFEKKNFGKIRSRLFELSLFLFVKKSNI